LLRVLINSHLCPQVVAAAVLHLPLEEPPLPQRWRRRRRRRKRRRRLVVLFLFAFYC
jgi:hypothetical protein